MTRARDVATQGGLVLVASNTFSGSSTISINNCFTSAYTNYLITYNGNGSANANFRLRFRANGTDYSATNMYDYTRIEMAGAGFFTESGLADVAPIGLMRPTKVDIAINVFSPFVSGVNSSLTSSGMYLHSGFNHGNWLGGTVIESTGQFDGFTIYPQTGTFSGTLRVYGIRN